MRRRNLKAALEVPRLAGLIVLLLGLLISFALAAYIRERNAGQLEQAYQAELHRQIEQIRERLQRYQYGLRGLRGAYLASGEHLMTPERFERYSRSRDIDKEFPGALGMGFIRRIPADFAAEYQERMHWQGRPDFRIRQLAPHDGERFVIEVVAPLSRNVQAIGLDIASEPLRREAAVRALNSGEIALTAPITLVQASGKPGEGFLMLLPAYLTGYTPATLDERQRAAFGWAYAPIMAGDVFSLPQGSSAQLALQVEDISAAGSSPFFQSGKIAAAVASRNATFVIYGRSWRLSLHFLPAFVAGQNLTSPARTLTEGTLLSLVGALLAYVLRLFALRKRELHASNERMGALLSNSSDAVIGLTPEGEVTDWNEGASALFGYAAAEAVGRPLAELITPLPLQADEARLLLRIRDGERISLVNSRRCHRNGQTIAVSMSLCGIRSPGGTVSGIAITLRDISAQESYQARILALNASLETQVSERTRELESSRATLSLVLDSVPSILGYWNRDLVNQVANAAYHDWLGVPPGSLPGSRFQEVCGELLAQMQMPHIRTVLDGQRCSVRCALPSPSGLLTHFQIDYVPDGECDAVRGFFMVMTDISDLVDSQIKLARSVQENQALLRTINEQMLFSITDSKGRILEINEAFCRLSGYSRQELIGKNHGVLSSGRHDRGFWQQMWGVINAGGAWHGEICNRTRSGAEMWLDTVIAPIRNERDEIERFLALRIDITRRYQTELELGRTSALLGNVLQAASEVSIVATDCDGLITVFNSGAERMLGYEADEVVGRLTPLCLHVEYEVAERSAELTAQYGEPVTGFATFVRVAQEQGSERRQWTFVRRDGSHLIVSLVVTPMYDAGGRISGYLGIATDITQQVQQQRELTAAKQAAEQASLAKGQFVANMSHEIRTPMNAVLGMLQLLTRTALDARQSDYVDKASGAARALLGLLNDILDFSKIEAGKLQLDCHPFQLEHLLRDLTTVLPVSSDKRDVDVIVEADPQLPQVLLGDQLRLLQVMINLASNAIKFTRHGHVHIELQQLERDAGSCLLRVSVSDTGIGMNEMQLTHLFQPFTQAEASTTRRFGGTGLGLAISYRLVQMMGGELQVSSQLGAGSCFSFSVRLAVDAQTDDGAPAPGPALKVLIVDDNELAGQALQRSCGQLGWQACWCRAGVLALRDLAQAAREQHPFQVVLIDWHMPMMDGLQALQLMQHSHADAQCHYLLMAPAWARSELESRLHQGMGAPVGIVEKPLTTRQLGEAIWRQLDPQAAPYATRSPQADRRLAGLNILVVEDNPLNQQVALDLLSAEGASVHLAEGGIAGVRRVCDGQERFDLLLMDMQMPDMDGLEATRRIRADGRFAGLPIVAMTANAALADREACLAAGMNAHVGKPFDIDELVPLLCRLAGQGAGGTEPLLPSARAAASALTEPDSEPDAELIEDAQHIRRRLGANATIIRTVVERFLPEALELLRQLEHSRKHNEYEPLCRVLHTLKGMAGTAGARAVSHRAGVLEQRVHDAPPGQALEETVRAEDMQQLHHDCEACACLLQDLLAPGSAP